MTKLKEIHLRLFLLALIFLGMWLILSVNMKLLIGIIILLIASNEFDRLNNRN